MKILSLYIKKFGKLSDYSLNFTDGLNVLRECNGFGKTTLASFVKAMFYGLSHKSRHNSLGEMASDATKYLPWNSSEKFGGNLTLEHQGKTYRVERFFAKSAKDDQLKVVCVETGAPLVTELTLGEYFLGLTEQSFERSMYYPQESVEVRSNDNFDKLLAGVVEDGGANGDKAVEKLRDKRKELKAERGNGGRINQIEDLIDQKQCQLADIRRQEAQLERNNQRLQQITEEKQLAGDNLLKCKQQLDELKRQQNIANNSQQQELSRQIDELDVKIAECPESISQDLEALQKLDAMLTSLEVPLAMPKPEKTNPLTMVYIVLLAAFAVFAGFLLHWLAGVGLGVLWVLLCYYLYRKKTTENNKNMEVLQQMQTCLQEFNKLSSKYARGTSRKQILDAMINLRNEREKNISVREALLKKLDRDAPSEDYSAKIVDAEVQCKQLEKTLTDLTFEEGMLVTQNKQLCTVSAVQIEDGIENLLKQKALLQNNYDVLSKAMELLAVAKENLSASYIPQLAEKTTGLLQKLSSKSLTVGTDRNFVVSITENGQTHLADDYSRGTREMVLLCFRLALSNLIYNGNLPFVMIDDAFVNYDDANYNSAIKMLANIAENGTQVIYFTCHNR